MDSSSSPAAVEAPVVSGSSGDTNASDINNTGGKQQEEALLEPENHQGSGKEQDQINMEPETKLVKDTENKNNNNNNIKGTDPTTEPNVEEAKDSKNTQTKPPTNNNEEVAAHESWDNTNRKVVIHNMFKFLDGKKSRKLAEQWAQDASKGAATSSRIEIYKVRKPPSDTFMVVTLSQTHMVQPFVDYINNNPNVTNKRGGKLFAKPAVEKSGDDDNDENDDDERDSRDQGHKKRKNRDEDDKDNPNKDDDDDGSSMGGGGGGNRQERTSKRGMKRQHRDTIMEEARRPITADEIRERITPLFRLTPQQQAGHKQRDMIRNCARKMIQEIKGRFRALERDVNRRDKNKNNHQTKSYKWLNQQRCINVDKVCTVPSPLRNKVEFTFGYRYIYQTNPSTQQGEQQEQATMQVESCDPMDTKTTSDDDPNSKTPVAPDSKSGLVETDVEMKEATTNKTNSNEVSNDQQQLSKDDQMSQPLGIPDEKETIKAPATGEGGTSSNTAGGEGNTTGLKDELAQKHQEQQQPATSKISSLGFMAAGWSGGVSKPHACANIPSEMCTLVDLFEDFLKDSPLPPYDPKHHQGFWRYLTVRTSRRTQQCLLILVHAPVTGGVGDDGTVDYSLVWETEKKRLIQTLESAELPIKKSASSKGEGEEDVLLGHLKITSLFFQEFEGVSHPPPEHPIQHVFGQTVLEERLGKCRFQISPGAFFQVNTEGAELLYQIVMDKLSQVIDREDKNKNAKNDVKKDKESEQPSNNASEQPSNNSTTKKKRVILFDVCCGTGTIGLACLKEGVVDQVVGIDISEPAIQDAKRNAELNGFGNQRSQNDDGTSNDDMQPTTRFVASRAEHVMAKEISRATKAARSSNSNVEHVFLAVVDPAREGLHADVVKALRQTEQIQRIVYVSCNPTGSLIKDAGLLCAPPTKRYSGRAFRPTSASPVDMFPLTNHCEMVMTFDRVQDDEM
ncbi:hypothetical protein ACA910_006982 [Epithemia clementina (nom. ined.)]